MSYWFWVQDKTHVRATSDESLGVGKWDTWGAEGTFYASVVGNRWIRETAANVLVWTSGAKTANCRLLQLSTPLAVGEDWGKFMDDHSQDSRSLLIVLPEDSCEGHLWVKAPALTFYASPFHLVLIHRWAILKCHHFLSMAPRRNSM